MSNYQWPPDSFEAQALRAARKRKDDERSREEDRRIKALRARESHFASLMEPVFGDRWPRLQQQHGMQITELQYGELCFSLAEVAGQPEPVLAVSAQCPVCKRAFERRPVISDADVGDLLAHLQEHPNCASPLARAAAKRKRDGHVGL